MTGGKYGAVPEHERQNPAIPQRNRRARLSLEGTGSKPVHQGDFPPCPQSSFDRLRMSGGRRVYTLTGHQRIRDDFQEIAKAMA